MSANGGGRMQPQGADLFDPALYRDVRRPLSQASLLPAWCYTSQEFYRRECERVFQATWNPIGRVDDIPNPGDYFTTELVGVPLIVVRDEKGAVHAFVNSCRHRGTVLVEGTGNRRDFTCPYHSWCYALDGKLISSPGMDGVENFDRRDFPLIGVTVDVWAGFLFVNLDAQAKPLDAYIGDLKSALAPYDMGDMGRVRQEVFDLRCNWKLLVENFKESYHLATVHATTINRYASIKTAGYDVEEPNGEYLISFATHDGSMALLRGDKGFPPIETLVGKTRHGSHFPVLYPAMCICTTIDCCWYLQIHPQGPGRTRLVVGSLFPKKTIARSDFDAVVQNYFKRWDTTVGEDNAICELQQKGLESGVALPPGRFAPREMNVHAIDNWILDRVLDGPRSAIHEQPRAAVTEGRRSN